MVKYAVVNLADNQAGMLFLVLILLSPSVFHCQLGLNLALKFG